MLFLSLYAKKNETAKKTKPKKLYGLFLDIKCHSKEHTINDNNKRK